MQGFSCILGFTPPTSAAELQPPLLPRSVGASRRLHESLRVLHIEDTKLSSVPQAVTQLRELEHLSLTRCSLFVSSFPFPLVIYLLFLPI